MSPIWPIGCSQSVHQNSQTSGGLDETVWLSDDNVHRRQFAASAIKRGSPGTGQTDGGLIRGPGFLRELPEVCVGSPAVIGVSGVPDRFQIDDRRSPSGEIGQNSQSGKEPPGPDFHNRKGASIIHWESQFSNVSHPTGSFILSGSARSETCHPFSLLGPRLSHCCDEPREGGAFVVDGAGKTLERVQPETAVSLPKDSDRCFKIGMGRSLSWGPHRWAVDVRGKSMSHQLPGVVGSISGNSVVCEEREAPDSVPLHGQCLSSDLHQQER